MNIAAINFFPFHYEMFGYIINYCYDKNTRLQRNANNYETQYVNLTIYTETAYNFQWLYFYKLHFLNKLNFDFKYKPLHLIQPNLNNHDCVFIPTDDDLSVASAWITPENKNKFICIQHYFMLRNPIYNHYIALRPYDNTVSPFVNWALPCYPIVNLEEKQQIVRNNALNDETRNTINIVILGGIREKYNSTTINRLFSVTNAKIVLHIVATYLSEENLDILRNSLSNHITLNAHKGGGVETTELIQLIINSDYVLLDVTTNTDHVNRSMSGCIPLAFSCLTQLIISKRMNNFYKFKNALEYDMDNAFPILLPKDCDYQQLHLERQQLVLQFTNYVDTCIDSYQPNGGDASKINTALIVEPRKLRDLPIVINKFKTMLGENWKIVYYCGANDKQYWINEFLNYGVKNADKISLSNVEIRELQTNDLDSNQYNDLLKQKNLWKSLYGKYVLVFQSDTWLKNNGKYSIDYFTNLNKSYIGGNMNYRWREFDREGFYSPYSNFNGGLSLRNRNDILKIIEHYPPQPTVINSTKMESDPEDVYITLGCRRLNLPIGDDEECCRFSIHTVFYDDFFGMHQPTSNLNIKILSVCPDVLISEVLNKTKYE